MFPIREHNPSAATPWVTYLLIAANVAIFAAMAGVAPPLVERFYLDWALPKAGRWR